MAIRFITAQIRSEYRPWNKSRETYFDVDHWFCIVDTGKQFVDPKTSKIFYQNYDEEFYVILAKWCEGEFARSCRVSYNQYCFNTQAELNLFLERWA